MPARSEQLITSTSRSVSPRPRRRGGTLLRRSPGRSCERAIPSGFRAQSSPSDLASTGSAVGGALGFTDSGCSVATAPPRASVTVHGMPASVWLGKGRMTAPSLGAHPLSTRNGSRRVTQWAVACVVET